MFRRLYSNLVHQLHRFTSRAQFAAAVVLTLVCSVAAAQPITQPQVPPAPSTPPTSVPPAKPTFPAPTREDLAIAYQRIDAMIKVNPPPPEQLAQVNKTFDAVTLSFFAGRFASAVQELAQLAGTLSSAENQTQAQAWQTLRSLTVRFDLTGPNPSLTFHSLFPLPHDINAKLFYEIGSMGSELHQIPLNVPAGQKFESSIPLSKYVHPHLDRPLSVTFTIPTPGSSLELWESRQFILPSPEHAANIAEWQGQLADTADKPGLDIARSIVQARLALVDQPHNTQNSAHFLGFRAGVLAELPGNLKLMRYGMNPFKNHDGLVFRPIIAEGAAIPMYVYAPPQSFNRGPVPLIIALHGAGGDEAMFLSAYGNGEAKRQAEDHGCILACPSTTAFMTSPALFDTLVNQLAADYPIDRSRVFVIGHSMGAAAASGLARTRATSLAGVVCLAGGRMPTKPMNAGESLAPMLAIYATLDPLTDKIDINRINEAAKTNALPIEAREMQNWGHTLMVGPALPQAFEWMMEQKPRAQMPPTAK
ncbi:MAG: dienelactone hydrolase family protein [Planctomycetes bacterium]|nr:dienelactone hydrolase family protein [Planctomycetota bacterium]